MAAASIRAVSRWPARAILLLVGGLIAFGLATPTAHVAAERGRPARHQITDVELYRLTTDGIAKGGRYYPVMAEMLRTHNYPLKPFFTFRQPLLDSMIARIGAARASTLLIALATLSILAWAFVLRSLDLVVWVAAIAVMVVTAIVLARPSGIWWHEGWAGYLVILAIGLRRPQSWLPSVLVLTLAALFREFVLIAIVIMALCALGQRRTKEAIAYGIALIVAIGAIAWHAHEVAQVVLPGDRVSQGWHGMQGWRLLLTMMRLSTPLEGFPAWLTALAVPLAFLGWGLWRSSAGLRVFLIAGAWSILFMIAARTDNFYWGRILAGLLLPGIALAPMALFALLRTAAGPRLEADDPA